MELRRPSVEDVPEIEDIAKKGDHTLPDGFECAAVVENNDQIIAFGVLRTNIEALLYCIGTERERVTALNALINTAKADAKRLGHVDILVFARDEQFAKLLIKHFNFRRAKGVPLILDL